MKNYKRFKRQAGAVLLTAALAVPVFQPSFVYAEDGDTQVTTETRNETETPEDQFLDQTGQTGTSKEKQEVAVQESDEEIQVTTETRNETETPEDQFLDQTGQTGASKETQEFTVQAANEEIEWGYSIPADEFSSVQIGDQFRVGTPAFTTVKIEVIEGQDCVKITTNENQDSAEFIKSGNVTLKVTGIDEEGLAQEKTLDFVISPRTESTKVKYLFPNRLKLGDSITGTKHEPWGWAEFENCLYGIGQSISPTVNSQLANLFIQNGGWGSGSSTEPNRKASDVIYGGTAYRPGVLEVYSTEGEEERIIGEIYEVVIEEPVINTNLPETITVGDSINVTTALENTHLDNYKVDEIPQYDGEGDYFPFGYRPKIEILEGENLVTREDGDYSNTLHTSETFTFTGTGKVVFNIVYEMIEPYNLENYGGTYNPEKVVTVNVTENQSGTENPDSPNTPEKLDDEVVQNIITTIQNTKEGSAPIIVNMGSTTVVPKEILEVVKGKNIDVTFVMAGYSWTINGKNIFSENLQDINLEVKFDTNAIPDNLVKEVAGDNLTKQISLTYDGDFGFIARLTMNVGKEYGGKTGNLYYYNNKNLELTTSGKIAEDGNISLDFSHASDYVLVMSNADIEQQDTQNTIQSVQTGDETSVLPYILSLIVCLGIGGSVIKKRYFSK